MRRTVILGTGHYVPPSVVTNFDLEKLMDTSDEWIRERTGIIERRFVEQSIIAIKKKFSADNTEIGETGPGTSDLALQASLRAIEDAKISKEEIDFIIFATLSPDHLFPGAGVFLQAKLGLEKIGALDIRNQCTGFIYGLAVADQFIRNGVYKKILLVGAEIQSVQLNFSTQGRDMAVLFGDGAGAVILGAEEDSDRGVISTHLHADGRYTNILWIEKPNIMHFPYFYPGMFNDPGIYPSMQGKLVFKLASEKMSECVKKNLEENNLSLEDIDLLIPHQANYRITDMVGRALGLPQEKVFSNIHKYGNTTAASIPIALDEARKEGRLEKGDLLVLVAFGSGLTWGSALIRI